MTWEQLLVAGAVGFIGTAGVGALLTSLTQITRPARLRRHAEGLAAVRDLLPDGSESRLKLELALEAKADRLAATAASAKRPSTPGRTTWGDGESRYVLELMTLAVGFVVAAVAATVLIVATSDDPPGAVTPWGEIAAVAGGVVAAIATEVVLKRRRGGNDAIKAELDEQ
jgi:hypothetical protein